MEEEKEKSVWTLENSLEKLDICVGKLMSRNDLLDHIISLIENSRFSQFNEGRDRKELSSGLNEAFRECSEIIDQEIVLLHKKLNHLERLIIDKDARLKKSEAK